MPYTCWLYIIIFLVALDFFVGQYFSWLNRKAALPHLPTPLQGLYDKDKYAEQQRYFRVNNQFSQLTRIVNFVLIITLLLTGTFGWLNDWSSSLFPSAIGAAFVYFCILLYADELLSLPFEIYDTFVIESRFGFNKMTPRTFITDKIKSYIIGTIVGGGLLSLVVLFYTETGHLFWIYACMVVVGVMILFNMFYSDWIVPLFNKQTPLPPGELRTAIELFAQKAGFKLGRIYVMDGSKRSTRANAYFSGFGPTKRIVLYDTLIEDLTTDEIVAVLAHEIGHYKHKDSLRMIGLSVIHLIAMFYLLSLVINSHSLTRALGSNDPSFQLSLVAFALLFSPIGLLTGIIFNSISRKQEYRADTYAASYGMANELISGLQKISVKSLTNLTPDPHYTFVYYSHPTLLQRMGNLQNINKVKR